MLIPETKEHVEATGLTKTTKFGMGDSRIIIEYLTKKIYTNISRVIIQEVGSNARDAHREYGTPNKPIRIKLPTRLDPSLSIRDFGPGMNPERIEVFKSYGNSTKRNDNMQTGGFGIGGKTPWAYADTFTINTTSIEDGKMVKREYAAVKSANHELDCVELGEPVVIDPLDASIPEQDRHTGTTISLVINKNDFSQFTKAVIEVTQFWDVRPEVENLEDHDKWDDFKVLFEQPGWKFYGEGCVHNPIVCIDQIPYPLTFDTLDLGSFNPYAYGSEEVAEPTKPFKYLNTLRNAPLVLFFGVGELSVALNRESLQYDDITKQKVIERLAESYKWMQQQIENELAACVTLREAIIKYTKMQASFKISQYVKKPTWQGHSVNRHSMNISGKMRRYEVKSDSLAGKRVRGSDVHQMTVNEHTRHVLKDEDDLSILKLYTLFEKWNCTYIEVMIPPNDPKALVEFEDWKKNINFDLMEVELLSKTEKMKRVRLPKGHSTVVKAYTYNGRTDNSALNNWNHNYSCDITDGTGVFVEVDRGNAIGYPAGRLHDVWVLLGKPTIIGVPTRFAKNMGDNWTTLNDYIDQRVEDIRAKVDLDKVARKTVLTKALIDEVISYSAGIDFLNSQEFTSLITDKHCPLFQWIKKSDDYTPMKSEDYPEYRLLCQFAELRGTKVDLPQVVDDITPLMEECLNRYPLLFAVLKDYHLRMHVKEYTEELASAVNVKNNLTLTAIAV